MSQYIARDGSYGKSTTCTAAANMADSIAFNLIIETIWLPRISRFPFKPHE